MAQTVAKPAHPEEERRQSAHMLAIFLLLQGAAALGSLAWLVTQEGLGVDESVAPLFVLVAILSIVGAVLEWTRMRWAEAVATGAILLSFGLTLAAVLAGYWYLVPFVGLTTIAAIFGLVDRFAVRDEARHQPRRA